MGFVAFVALRGAGSKNPKNCKLGHQFFFYLHSYPYKKK